VIATGARAISVFLRRAGCGVGWRDEDQEASGRRPLRSPSAPTRTGA
jgi:hypothetical protein